MRGGNCIFEWFLIDDYISSTGLPICIVAKIKKLGSYDVVSYYHARYISGKYIVYESACPTLDCVARVREIGCKLEESEVIYAKSRKNNKRFCKERPSMRS